jgi:uncharacterized damage-inducible protein DinB
MKRISALAVLLITFFGVGASARAQERKPMSLKDHLLEQLRETHKTKGTWFVDTTTAVSGLTPEQASWRDSKGNHSVGQLLYHMMFWNRFTLEGLKGDKKKFEGSNEQTFDTFDAKKWNEIQQQFDEVMTELENFVQNADDEQVQKIAKTVLNIAAHNAYHTGEIVYVRKEQGSWDAKKGVS